MAFAPEAFAVLHHLFDSPMTPGIDPSLRTNGIRAQWSSMPMRFTTDTIDVIFAQLRYASSTGDLTLGKPVIEFGDRHAIGVATSTAPPVKHAEGP